ncbi:hypothetical protein OAP94_01845 [bacterium]|nr:hypothetical protein [bacterium]MDC1007405.1 hypothetical protein [bacterium]
MNQTKAQAAISQGAYCQPNLIAPNTMARTTPMPSPSHTKGSIKAHAS